MALSINTNVAALEAQINLRQSSSMLRVNQQRLSSGLRINSAKDDAAGLAISNRFTAQIKGLNQASRNAGDGISLAQTAEGAMDEVSNILQRVRELAVQSANDSNSADDRQSLQAEVTQLQNELNRIAKETSFNSETILDGSFTAKNFQVGAFQNQTISFSIDSVHGDDIGAHVYDTDNAIEEVQTGGSAQDNGVTSQDISVSGKSGSGSITLTGAESAKTIAGAINDISSDTGVEAEARTEAEINNISSTGAISFSMTGSGTATVSANVTDTSDMSSLAEAVNEQSSETGITAQLSGDNSSITLISKEGDDIKLDFSSGSNDISFQGAYGSAATVGANNDNYATVGGNVKFVSDAGFFVSSDTDDTVVPNAGDGSSLESVSSIDITTRDGANDAIRTVDQALGTVDSNRSDLGAVQNRLESTIANIDSSVRNLTDSRSRILDADIAKEAAELAQNQVRQQAGAAVLAQANQNPQLALQLLGT